jgi:hypothetical protein
MSHLAEIHRQLEEIMGGMYFYIFTPEDLVPIDHDALGRQKSEYSME